MSETRKEKTLIGRAEKIRFPSLGDSELYARIDTGAKTSSIWATDIIERDEGLEVRFASATHAIHEHPIIFAHYDRVRVASSMGHQQVRYRIKMPIVIHGRRIMATFTLSDRSTQVYPVLIGRATLNGKFIVDVSQGSPLLDEEKQRSIQLQDSTTEEHV
jgi:hypothetical protein